MNGQRQETAILEQAQSHISTHPDLTGTIPEYLKNEGARQSVLDAECPHNIILNHGNAIIGPDPDRSIRERLNVPDII